MKLMLQAPMFRREALGWPHRTSFVNCERDKQDVRDRRDSRRRNFRPVQLFSQVSREQQDRLHGWQERQWQTESIS
jgi:hypothetical protein